MVNHFQAVRQHINLLLINDRDQLSEFDVKILKDCLELIEQISSLEDKELIKTHTVSLTIKLMTFFTKPSIKSKTLLKKLIKDI